MKEGLKYMFIDFTENNSFLTICFCSELETGYPERLRKTGMKNLRAARPSLDVC